MRKRKNALHSGNGALGLIGYCIIYLKYDILINQSKNINLLNNNNTYG